MLGQLEVTGLGVRLLDGSDLGGVALLELGENKDQEILSELKNLVVVVVKGLLEIKTSKLQVISIAITKKKKKKN